MSSSTRRQLRHRRRRGVAVALTDRDCAVLHALSRFRLARTSDIVAYAFAGVRRDTAAVRLRRLFDARFLAVLPPRPGVENLYRLGPAGKAWLAGEGVPGGRVPRGGHEHHLAVVQTWVAIAGLDGLELERALPDWETREQFRDAELYVVPDLLLVVRAGEHRHAVAVEVDRGTESLAFLNQKFEVYRSLWGRPPGLFGWEQFGLAVACPSAARRATLASVIKKAWVVPCVMWVMSDGPRMALRKLFEEMKPPLMTSPCCKGRLDESEGADV